MNFFKTVILPAVPSPLRRPPQPIVEASASS